MLTPEQIKAKGYTILTSPSQTKDYNIAGQSGTTGAKGSFLYGTPKASRSLEGTLPPETGGDAVGQRTLPQSTSGLASFRQGLQEIDNYFRANQDTPQQVMQKLGTQLGEIINPNVMSSALGDYSALRQRGTESIFKSAVDLISEQQANQEKYTSTIMSSLPKSFLTTMSGKDWDELRSGNVTPELKQRLEVAQQSETEVPTQITEVNNRKLLVNTQTGEVIRDLGYSGPTGGGGGGGGETETEVVSPEIDTLAKAYLRGETLGSIGSTKKAQVMARAEELKKQEASMNRPKTVEAVTKLIQTARDEGYSDEEIIQSFVEDFGFTRESAERMIKSLI